MSEWKQFEYSDLVPSMLGKVIAVVNGADAEVRQVVGTIEWYRERKGAIEIGLSGLGAIDVVGERPGSDPRLFLYQPPTPGILRQRNAEEASTHHA